MIRCNLQIFAHHKDIDKAASLLDGIQGWHIIDTKTGRRGKRKDKRLV